ncbi:MAG: Uma2 family endonuclease [Pirellulales bacterium]|nr:Uma2 family endonuclease [Pirellulales bacterium]
MSMPPLTSSQDPEPAWDVATLFPGQGHWSEFEYLSLTQSTNRLVELKAGRIKVLPMPTMAHHLIVIYLLEVFKAFVKSQKLGIVLIAPLRVRISLGEFREPDLVFMRSENKSRAANEFWDGADLVLEVVSKDAESRRRDHQDKRADYAAAGIPEYWIVDPVEKRITVLTLEGREYAVLGEFTPGQQAASRLLKGLSVDVTATFKAADDMC